MYYIGFCSSCGGGVLGVRICGEGDVVALCDECDALWLSPVLKNSPQFPEQPDLPCPYCRQSLIKTPARWATTDDLALPQNKHWRESILGTGEPLGESDDSSESFT
ncbi:hypothetical protein MNBD_PLANCTO02-1413 [hydrothermal vent metagenome]|uniref:Transcription factor zinc-finger domain-containing protein n=1 Tax=hydrothermal vent metagenome TaxID=652676 RepID=A0A3B1E607_9ZZZZ